MGDQAKKGHNSSFSLKTHRNIYFMKIFFNYDKDSFFFFNNNASNKTKIHKNVKVTLKQKKMNKNKLFDPQTHLSALS